MDTIDLEEFLTDGRIRITCGGRIYNVAFTRRCYEKKGWICAINLRPVMDAQMSEAIKALTSISDDDKKEVDEAEPSNDAEQKSKNTELSIKDGVLRVGGYVRFRIGDDEWEPMRITTLSSQSHHVRPS